MADGHGAERDTPDRARQRVVIVGGGTAGWMAAAAIERFVGAQASITLVESDEIGTVGVGEATIPQLRLFNSLLGIDEDAFVAATEGTFKLGIEFVGWTGPGSRYIHAFGAIGRALGVVPFHHYWLRHRASGGATGLWDYSASALAAGANRFGRPAATDGSHGVAWAFHFDAALYAAFLRRLAEERGVGRIEGRVVEVARVADDGDIAAIVLADGRRIEGDLFIDCSGFRALLIGEAMGAALEDWSRWLPCDRALAVPSAGVRPLPPYTRATAREAGWQWRIPLQHRTGNGHVYCGAFTSEEAAADALLAGLGGAPLAEPRPLRFTTGRRTPWVGNVVALGLAAGFMEPLESTSIHLVQASISRLLQLWPGRRIAEADRAAFNRQSEAEWLAIRDFLVLHYHANRREGEFWRMCRDMTLPDGLAERIALFRANGRLFRHGEELFTEVGWLQVLIGQRIVPSGHHPLADRLTSRELDGFLRAAGKQARSVAAAMPDHAAFVARGRATSRAPASVAA